MALNNAINAPLPISSTNGGTGISAPTAHGILVAEGASPVNPIVLSNGQLLIGSTGVDPVAANLTAGVGISITPGAGSITIAANGTFTWNNVTGTSQAMLANNGYISNNASVVTLTLPATAAIGDQFSIAGNGAGGFTIAQNAGQTIHFGDQNTTSGTGGSLASTNRYDQLSLLCTAANTDFVVRNAVGNLTVV